MRSKTTLTANIIMSVYFLILLCSIIVNLFASSTSLKSLLAEDEPYKSTITAENPPATSKDTLADIDSSESDMTEDDLSTTSTDEDESDLLYKFFGALASGMAIFTVAIALIVFLFYLIINLGLVSAALIFGWIGYTKKKCGFTITFAIISLLVTFIPNLATYFFFMPLISSILGFIGAKKQKNLNTQEESIII